MSADTRAGRLAAEFRQRFGSEPRVYRAPGRVNLIGEHTDYSGGLVMPVAIDLFTWLAANPRPDRMVRAYSKTMGESHEFALDADTAEAGWARYLQGVAAALEDAGHRVSGADLLIDSDVPLGSGLSSSAALEVALGLAFASEAGHEIERTDLAKICQRAENHYVGVQCGIMDQMAAACGQPGHALMIDCENLACTPLPLPPDVRIIVANTMVRHAHGTGEYNRRREELEAGLQALGDEAGPAQARLVTAGQVEAADIPDVPRRRVRHVVTENGRVEQAAVALTHNDFSSLARLMAQSHRSLRDDYEVSCPELDAMVEAAQRAPGVRGTRMTGGGFGGCTVSLVDESEVDAFKVHVAREYRDAVGRVPALHVCSAAPGAQAVALHASTAPEQR